MTAKKVSQGRLAAPGTQETGALGDRQESRAGRETVGHQASWERSARRGTAACQAPKARRARREPQGAQGHQAERELQDRLAPGARRAIQDHPASRLPVCPVLEERRVTEASQDQKDLLAPRAMQEIKVPVVPLA